MSTFKVPSTPLPPSNFDFSGGVVTDIAGTFRDAGLANVTPVEEGRRASQIVDAMNAGSLYPDLQSIRSPAPYPSDGAAQPAITGASRLPSGPRI
jgi:hypothetical protein